MTVRKISVDQLFSGNALGYAPARTSFHVLPLYTFKNERSPFNTAQIFRDGVPKGSMNLEAAKEYCEKWNGRRGNFEVK